MGISAKELGLLSTLTVNTGPVAIYKNRNAKTVLSSLHVQHTVKTVSNINSMSAGRLSDCTTQITIFHVIGTNRRLHLMN